MSTHAGDLQSADSGGKERPVLTPNVKCSDRQALPQTVVNHGQPCARAPSKPFARRTTPDNAVNASPHEAAFTELG